MNVLSWNEFTARISPVDIDNADKGSRYAATVGVFDGLHRGHMALLRRVCDDSRGPCTRAQSVVLTFRENPKKLLRPESFRGDLLSMDVKLKMLDDFGVDLCVLIDFSTDFGTLSGVDFLRALYASGLRYLAVGPDFRCGHHQDTGPAALVQICAKLGIRLELMAPVLWEGHPVSSSRIRHAVLEGRLDDAQAMLGRPYALEFSPLGAGGPVGAATELRAGAAIELRAGAAIELGAGAAIEPGAGAATKVLRFARAGLLLPPPGQYEGECIMPEGRVKATARCIPHGGVYIDNSIGRKALGFAF